MKCALVIIEIPEEKWRKDANAATNCANQILDNVQSRESIQEISPSVFLCSLKHGLHEINTIVGLAKVRGLTSRTLFFDQDPSWVVSEP